MRVALIGVPGAGKSTLANLMGTVFNVMVVSSGALARANGFANSEAEKEGKLDPNEEKIRALVKEAIGTSNRYILDGFPRTVDQIEAIGIKFDAVIYMNMVGNEHIAIERLLNRGRPDDTMDIINKRLETYYTHTAPLIDYFDDMGVLVRVKASGTIAQTLRQATIAMYNKELQLVREYVGNVLKSLGTTSDETLRS